MISRENYLRQTARLTSRSCAQMMAQKVSNKRASRSQMARRSDHRLRIVDSVSVRTSAGQFSATFDDARYTIGSNGHDLLLVKSNIDRSLESKVATASPQLVLQVVPHLAILRFRFGPAESWGDAPFAWHLQPACERRLPIEPTYGERANLRIRLMDSNNGRVCVTRSIEMSSSLTFELHSAIRRQATSKFDAIALVQMIASSRLSPLPAESEFELQAHSTLFQ